MPRSSRGIDISNLAYLAQIPFLISWNQSLAFPILMVLLTFGMLLKPAKLGNVCILAISGLILLLWIFSFLRVIQFTSKPCL